MKNIIDFGMLEEPIKEIESILSDYDHESSNLILSKVVDRRRQQIMKQQEQEQAQRILDGVSVKNVMKRVFSPGDKD